MLHPHEQEDNDFAFCANDRFDGFDRGDGPEQWDEELRCQNEEFEDNLKRERQERIERMQDAAEQDLFVRQCRAEAKAKKQRELAHAIRAVEAQAKALAKSSPKYTRVRALTIEDTLSDAPTRIIA